MTIKHLGGIFGRNPTFNEVNMEGNIIMASGKGIDFSATAGVGTSELFDDYEEGTWTPTVTSSSGTLTTVDNIQGFYTKIGRDVTLWAHATITNNGTGSGHLVFTGLPFAPAATTLAATGYIGVGYNSSSGLLLQTRVTGTSNAIQLRKSDFSYPVGSGNSVTLNIKYYVS